MPPISIQMCHDYFVHEINIFQVLLMCSTYVFLFSQGMYVNQVILYNVCHNKENRLLSPQSDSLTQKRVL